MVVECTAHGTEPVPASGVRIVVIGDKEGVTTEMANFSAVREAAGDQELNLSKDTVLLKYLLEPTASNEVAAFELSLSGSERSMSIELLDNEQQRLQVQKGLHQCTLVYCPLKAMVEGGTFTLLCTILAPDADLMAAEADKAKEAAKAAKEEGAEGIEVGAAMKCSYTLTVNSLSAFGISVDTRRQDRAIELKTQWEEAEKGRAERAKAARDKHLAPGEEDETAHQGTAKDPAKARRPVVRDAGADQALAKVMTNEQRAERLEAHEKEVEDYKAGQEEVGQARLGNADQWRRGTEARTGAWETQKSDNETFWADQSARREAYKAGLAPKEE